MNMDHWGLYVDSSEGSVHMLIVLRDRMLIVLRGLYIF